MKPIQVRWPSLVAGAAILFASGAFLSVQSAHAQGGRIMPIDPMPQRGGPDPGPRGMMAMPTPTVINDGAYLYVIMGPQMFKVSKSDLSVVAHGQLGPGDRAAAVDMAPARSDGHVDSGKGTSIGKGH